MARTLEQDCERKRLEYLADPEKHKQRKRESVRKPQGREKQMFYSARGRARKKSIEFNIDLVDIVIPEVCPVFNVPFTPLGTYGEIGFGLQNDFSPSLDRIDNTKGYVKGNIGVISWKANNLKGSASLEDLKNIVTYLESVK